MRRSRVGIGVAVLVAGIASSAGSGGAQEGVPERGPGFVLPTYVAPDTDLAQPTGPRQPTALPARERLGTANPDRIRGLPIAETIDGLGGADVVDGGGGDDVVAGDVGPDTVRGGPGNDFLTAAAGGDKLDGGPGNDFASGGFGIDVLDGGPGSDLLYGDEAPDTLRGGDGDDVLHGGSARDDVFGGPGNDVIWGDSGFDALDGGAGDDVLHLNEGGKDRAADCGEGTDAVVLDAPGGPGSTSDAQMLRRGEIKGCETVVYAPAPPRDPRLGETKIAAASGAVLTGTAKDDTLLGDVGPDRLNGLAGDDVLWGSFDIKPSRALDLIIGGLGDDTVFGGPGRAIIDGGPGDDILNSGEGRATIRGGAGDDVIRTRGKGPHTVVAGPGDDKVFAVARAKTTVRCGPGNDVVELARDDKAARDCERKVIRK